MQAEQEFFIRIQDVGANYEATNKMLLEALTNATNVHGNSVGQGINNQGRSHISWVVLNWKLEVYKRPQICETILVRTWAQEYSKIRAHRDYDVFDQKGEIIAKATSIWVGINTATDKMIRLTDDIMNVYGCEPQHKNFPEFKFTKISGKDLPVISEIRFKINKSMIDYNNHVHNTSYIDLANEVLPEGMDDIHFNNIEISYKKEITPYDMVSLEYMTDGCKNFVFIRDKNKCKLHAVVVLY